MGNMKNTILVQIAFVAAMIAAAALVSWIASAIAVMFTHDVGTIVIACVVSVWMAEMALYVFRSAYLYNRRIRTMEQSGASHQDITVEKHRMKNRYMLAGAVFGGLLGYMCFGVYRNMVDVQESAEGIEGGIDWALAAKVTITVILLAVIIYRIKRSR